MYNIKKGFWESDAKDKELLRWSREEANSERPEAMFILGSELLSEIKKKGTTAEAVALMEESAKGGYPQAMFAMGQMFEYGWGVAKDRKNALVWYRRAAEKGYKPAAEYLAKMRRRRLVTVIAACLAVLIVAGASFSAWWFLSGMSNRIIIKVNKNTELHQTNDIDNYLMEFSRITEKYDTESVRSGEAPTNRVILRFEGDYLDLSDYKADYVIAREHNMMIIQFSSEEEARRCIRELSKLDGIVYVLMDEYSITNESVTADTSTLIPPTSELPQKGVLSWGVIDMGLDQLSAYVADKFPDRTLTVGIIDGGIRSQWSASDDDIVNRIIPGVNIVAPGKSPTDDYHGTHVGGTVLDGTRGTNIHVISIDVFNGADTTSISYSTLGIEYAMSAGVQVINRSMSWSKMPEDTTGIPEDVLIQLENLIKEYEDAVRRAVSSGIVFVNAAGNDTSTTKVSVPEVIVVGAYDINHNIASFSNFGSMVDVCAPGVNICSLSNDPSLSFKQFGGTSMASPHIAALAALLKIMYPNATPAQIETLIKDYCRTYVNPSAYGSGNHGEGAPDATAFIERDS